MQNMNVREKGLADVLKAISIVPGGWQTVEPAFRTHFEKERSETE